VINPNIQDIFPRVRVANFSDIQLAGENIHTFSDQSVADILASLRKHADLPFLFLLDRSRKTVVQEVVERLRAIRSSCYPHAIFVYDETLEPEDYAGVDIVLLESTAAAKINEAMERYARAKFIFDRKKLKVGNSGDLPAEVDVLIIGGGITGLYVAKRLQQEGRSFSVVEATDEVGGIWSQYANSTSQVNTSEGAYRAREHSQRNNRDHSPTSEILEDLSQIATEIGADLFTGTKAVAIKKRQDSYQTLLQRKGEQFTISSRGLIVAVNDRVGRPRFPSWKGRELFRGQQLLGSSDETRGLQWRGKKVVVVGMGAFAVENVRTALENGASHVTVVCRRHGTVCPKIIDYLNFATPYDERFQHEKKSNIRNMMLWKKLYDQSGATQPECWMGKIKHEGHTISVSDIWFIAHFLAKMTTISGSISELYEDGVILTDGQRLEADVVINCIGFHRNASAVKAMSDYTETYNNNYLDKDLMYLADAYIDDDVFNSFFGSSVLEMTRFYMEVYLYFFNNPEFEVMSRLPGIEKIDLEDRRWSHYIAGAEAMMAHYPDLYRLAREQIDKRTANFLESHDLTTYIAQNKREWLSTHELLAGHPMAESECLGYVFEKLVEKKL
jgi:hypothetical protein